MTRQFIRSGILLTTLFASLSIAAETVSNSVPLNDVTRIHKNGSSELYITQGDEEYVKVTTDRETLPEVEARVKGNTLYLGKKDSSHNWFFKTVTPPVRFDVQVKQLNQIRLNGSGHTFTDDLDVGKLKLNQSGSGKIEMKSLRAEDFTLSIAGSGEVNTSRIDTDEMELRIAGSGNIDVPDLQADEVEIKIAGSGDVTVENLDAVDLDINIAGSAAIDISGRVVNQHLEINGSGDYNAGKLISETTEIEVHGSGDVEVNVQKELTTELSRGAEVIYHGGQGLEIDANGRGKLRRAD